jgi:hypothetical protein
LNLNNHVKTIKIIVKSRFFIFLFFYTVSSNHKRMILALDLSTIET